jgi:hypothetical protein
LPLEIHATPWESKFDRANKIAHRDSFHEFARPGVDHDPILVAVTDPDVAVRGIHPDPLGPSPI